MKKRIVVTGLVLLCGVVLCFLLPKTVHGDNITQQDIVLLEEYCMKEFARPRSVKLGHSRGGNGKLYLCMDTDFRNSSQMDFHDVAFLSDFYEGKSHKGDVELKLYFKIEGYCVVERRNRTFYFGVMLTNPKRAGGKLTWEKIDIDAIVELTGNTCMYRFGDEPP